MKWFVMFTDVIEGKPVFVKYDSSTEKVARDDFRLLSKTIDYVILGKQNKAGDLIIVDTTSETV